MGQTLYQENGTMVCSKVWGNLGVISFQTKSLLTPGQPSGASKVYYLKLLKFLGYPAIPCRTSSLSKGQSLPKVLMSVRKNVKQTNIASSSLTMLKLALADCVTTYRALGR